MISDQQLVIVALSLCPGFGPKRLKQLFQSLELLQISDEEFWSEAEKYLPELRLGDQLQQQLLSHRQSIQLEKIRKQLEDRRVDVLTIFDPYYPALLKEIPDHPQVLYALGTIRSEWKLPIAVVGTRRITSYGRMVTKLIVKGLVASQAEIISGFMYGVDAMAHQTALDEGGYTVGVLGYGFDHLFPKTHQKLKQQLLDQGGLLLSEYWPEVPPINGHFPQRNRLIAGMSRGVVVTEATSKSGSKITAECAGEYGRDVFAVPGMITSPFSEGVKDLINNGAKLVTSAKDILEEYSSGAIELSAPSEVQTTQQKILFCLSNQPLDAYDLAQELQLEASELFTSLSLLEIQGQIKQEMGKYLLVL
jgi:DNA processing protein